MLIYRAGAPRWQRFAEVLGLIAVIACIFALTTRAHRTNGQHANAKASSHGPPPPVAVISEDATQNKGSVSETVDPSLDQKYEEAMNRAEEELRQIAELLQQANALRDTPKPDDTSSTGARYGNIAGRTTVVVLCYNRPDYLQRTLDALLAVPGIDEFRVVISQDGADAAVADLAQRYVSQHDSFMSHVKHTDRPSWANSGTMFLAAHYQRIMDLVFSGSERVVPPKASQKSTQDRYRADYAVLLEDDMLVSKDILHMFDQTAPLLTDSSYKTWCISSWNDNGFGDAFNLRPNKFLRTDFFPGLGWMLHRSLWTEELSKKWPRNHWDHWMRADAQHQGRSCIIPELSRNFNIGEQGAHVGRSEYDRFLRRISYYTGDSMVDFGDLSYLKYDAYSDQLKNLFNKADGKNVRLELYTRETFPELARRYNIWDGAPRTQFRHATILRPNSAKDTDGVVVLADRRRCPFLSYDDRIFALSKVRALPGGQGKDCEETCSRQGLQCKESEFEFINDCASLEKVFGCEKGCSKEWGQDIPNYVSNPSNFYFQWCLITDIVPSCTAKHADTSRLCPCQ
jgi:alpha-1,3-mannosyl-glycoprotein beta-1,2-N-acetylglucosaminyltransferase